MLIYIAKIVNRYSKTILISLVTLVVLAGIIGNGVFQQLNNGGLESKSSESYLASQRINQEFGRTTNNVVLELTFKSSDVNSPDNVAAAQQIEKQLSTANYINQVYSYWSSGQSANLKSSDNKVGLIFGSLSGTDNEVIERVKPITDKFSYSNQQLTVGVGGDAEINRQANQQIGADLEKAEIIALPITFLVLIIVFRSIIAAAIPVIFGLFSVIGSLFIIFVLTKFTDVNNYAANLTSMLSLGLAIDYSLFIIARFRESLAFGLSVEAAITQTIQKAGRTVVFSALTVALSLSALLVFPQSLLRSFAFSGIAVTIVSAIGSLLLVPSILRLLGTNINKWPIGKPKDYKKGSGFWRRIASKVIQHPIVISLSIVVVLLILATPFLSINLGQDDERTLPKSNPVRVVHDSIRSNFSSREASGIEIVSKSAAGVSFDTIDEFAISASMTKNVEHIYAATGVYSQGKKVGQPILANQFIGQKGAWFIVIPTVEALSPDGEQLVKDLRTSSYPFEIIIGGPSARLVDLKQSIFDKLPSALILIAISTFTLMFMMFGSILVPIKALAINILTMSAVLGAATWIFQFGNLSELLVFTPTGDIDARMPILIFCIAFGLSMDYEVFLLSRIKEDYDKTNNNTESIISGLEKTGGLVSAAAISISVVFLAFSTSGVTSLKLVGFSLFIAILVDAFIIRGTLVPAFMKMAGRANWWAPKFLRKLYKRFGISE